MTLLPPLHIKTPLLHSQQLQNEFGQSVYLKLEALQPSASFKIRGIGRLCQTYMQQGKTEFVASSGGNAGIAVAYSGMKLKIPVTVFIPKTSHPIYIQAIKVYGAKVIVAGDVWDEAHEAATQYASQAHAAYIPPFDHPIIWAGHSTMINEIAASGIIPDAIVAAVGGGGLACGILAGMQRRGWHEIPLIAVETRGADAFFQSIQAKEMITLPTITSKATSLGAKHVTPRLLKWASMHPIKSVVVTDEEAEQGARLFAKDKRILVELSAGAALSLAYHHHPVIRHCKTIVVIVCGGVNTSFFHLDE